MDKEKQKGLIKIVEQVQAIIDEKNIQVGEKLPSERFLSETLQVGRSSIREALRALELLGVIHTRRGEGTFLSDMYQHQLFDLIGSFLIRNDSQLDEINEVKWMIEHYCEENSDIETNSKESLVTSNNNQIMYIIWKILSQYSDRFEKGTSKEG
ncbi:FadR/GntR family transcriptional regulator [Mammaliicoccus stepanovicii]|uniref:GntR family transcriptional regulator n=1 Tax=Mammaliicoccus stepanovicii TaxID=643214 RepID=A0A239Z2J3_9STAP|nr:GntR family transcriptional regulator [Mammaliicoccus stepanovicii]PNZ78100.1 FadR family transcriptional regulator [Mammaliicoccus stepanovicii]GGI40341.1 GntR family transcriptional regulator [Mammaliicoccus stepanovicii]SNV64734.1 GntR family transcriptional regulator [Mammaliicoccus stepanovicii]